MIFAAAISVMVLAIGGAVDIGRWLQAKSLTKTAIDAAVLAGTRQLQVETDAPAAVAAAAAYYAANTRARLRLIDDTVTFAVTDDGMGVTATGQASIATPFLSLVRIDRLPLLDASGAEYGAATMSQGDQSRSRLEVSLMLDVTGSMSGQKIADLKAAATDLVNILVREGRTETRVALAPFSDAVRPGALLADVRASAPSTKSLRDASGRTRMWYRTSCVSERGGSHAYTDAAPAGIDRLSPVYTRDGGCTPGVEVVPLTADRGRLLSTIDSLQANGYTAGHLGTAWAWYLLSPYWASVLPGASVPAGYGEPNVKKVAVLMTDGEYNTQYDSNGLSTRDSGRSALNGASNTQARQLCQNMKAQGIEVYTVGFELDNQSAITTLADCASTPGKAFLANNGTELREVFRTIALALTPIHLTR